MAHNQIYYDIETQQYVVHFGEYVEGRFNSIHDAVVARNDAVSRGVNLKNKNGTE